LCPSSRWRCLRSDFIFVIATQSSLAVREVWPFRLCLTGRIRLPSTEDP
jgi:hypothetical protein